MRPRLLHLPNDPHIDDNFVRQCGPRDAFEGMMRDGTLSHYDAVLFLAEYRRSKNHIAVQRQILERVSTQQPDIIFWHHISEFPVDQAFFAELRSRAENCLIAYHEGDVFGLLQKKITRSTRTILSNADIVFSVSLGQQSREFRLHGAKQLRYLPHVFDPARFSTPWAFGDKRQFRVSMIANNWKSRIPGLYMPGGRNRIRLARKLTAIYGDEFALHGRGWDDLPSARGTLAFDQQVTAIRDSWVSANWDYYESYPYYFSDRLPISLVAGVPHVTTHHPGFEDMFRNCPGLYLAKSVDEVIDKIDWILSRTREEICDEGRRAQRWVDTNLNANVVYRRALGLCTDLLDREGRHSKE